MNVFLFIYGNCNLNCESLHLVSNCVLDLDDVFLIVNRFDLIFLILDQQDEVYDKRLARHLVSLYYRYCTPSADHIIKTSVPDPDPPGSELVGLKDPDPDPSLFHTKLRNMF